MLKNSHNFQHTLKLRSLKQLQFNPEENTSSSKLITSKNETNIRVKRIQTLSGVIKKMRVNNLVKKFVYQISRNVTRKNGSHYKSIQDKIVEKKKEENFIKSYDLNENIKAFIISLDIICLLIIQTLSTFHGFYDDYIEGSANHTPVILIEVFCLGIFFIKLIMGFTTPRISAGAKNKFMRYVAKEYVCSIIFVFNLLNFVTTLFKIIFPLSKAVGIVSFVISVLSMPVLTEDLEVVETTYINNFKKKHYYSMFKLLLFNVFFAQFISTMFIAIAYFDPQKNWMTKAHSNGNMDPDLTWWQQYFYALYWAIVTIATIGFGDITPANYFETGMLCILMLVGTIVLSYNVSSIGHIVQSLRSVDEQRKQETIVFKRMCDDERISPQLEDKIVDYIYKSAQIRQQFQFLQRKDFLQRLPAQLHDDLQSEYAKNTFSKMPFFKLLNNQTLVNFCLKLNNQIYYPGEDLVLIGGRLSKILFLKHGTIGLTYDKQGSKLNGLVLETRQINKINNQPYLLNKYLLDPFEKINYRMVAVDYCVMLSLEHQQFFEILKENKNDKEMYFQLRHQYELVGQEWDMFQCKECTPRKHSIFVCPKLHYMPYKSFTVYRYIYCPNIFQKPDRSYIRCNRKIKLVKPFNLWKNYFKQYENQWQINFHKYIGKSSQDSQVIISKIDFNQGKQHNNLTQNKITSLNFCQSAIYDNDLQKEDIIEQDLITKIGQKILNLQRLQQIEKNKKQQELQTDVMQNFQNYFLLLNPENLIKIPLRQLIKDRPKIQYDRLSNDEEIRDLLKKIRF